MCSLLAGVLAVNGIDSALNNSITATTGMTQALTAVATNNNNLAVTCAKQGADVMAAYAAGGDSSQVSVAQQIYSAYNQGFQNAQTSTNGLTQTDGTAAQDLGQMQQMWVQFVQDLMQLMSSLNSLLGSGKL